MLLKRLQIEQPIIQAPMAGVGTPALAAAVSNAGGLGSLGIGAASVDDARAAIRATAALTRGPFNVNLFCHQPAVRDPQIEAHWLQWLSPYFRRFNAEPPAALREIYPSFLADRAMLELLLQERPPIVSFHFGLPPEQTLAALRAAGTRLLATATSAAEALLIERAGLDAIIAQGSEAGGHRGVFDPHATDERLTTLALTRQLAQRCRTPIIAAGGIMDGHGIARALASGAQAAQLGTAFIACPEVDIDPGYRRALLSPDARTVFTALISGREARCLVNAFTALEAAPNRPTVPDYPVAYDAAKALNAGARRAGSHGYGAQWAGTGVRACRRLPAATLIATLIDEYTIAMRQ